MKELCILINTVTGLWTCEDPEQVKAIAAITGRYYLFPRDMQMLREMGYEVTQKEIEGDPLTKIEMRGNYQVIVKSDYEVWQLAYTDGSFGTPQIIPNDSNLLEKCSQCQRNWSPQDRGLRNDDNGQMICPDCQ